MPYRVIAPWLAAPAIGEERFAPRGLVPPNQYVDAEELLSYVKQNGMETVPRRE